MSKKTCAGGCGCKTTAAGKARSAKCAAKKAVDQTYGVQNGLPVFSMWLNELADCDPAQGADLLVRPNGQSMFFPVKFNDEIVGSVTMSKTDGDWKFQEFNRGWMGDAVDRNMQFYKKNGGRKFQLVHAPGIMQVLLRWRTKDGAKLMCLKTWPSDPAELAGATDEVQVLTILKEIAKRQMNHIVK